MPIFEGLTDYLGRTIRPILGKYAENDYREVKVDADGKLDVASAITIGDVNNKAYNGATWDEWRNNTEVELLASAARTATASSAYQTNYNARGVLVFLYVTAEPGTADTIQLRIRTRINGQNRSLLTSATIAGNAGVPNFYTFIVYPGATNSASDPNITKVNDLMLPRNWYVQMDHVGAGSFTYSVSAQLIV